MHRPQPVLRWRRMKFQRELDRREWRRTRERYNFVHSLKKVMYVILAITLLTGMIIWIYRNWINLDPNSGVSKLVVPSGDQAEAEIIKGMPFPAAEVRHLFNVKNDIDMTPQDETENTTTAWAFTTKAAAGMIKEMLASEVRPLFNTKNDITPEEEAESKTTSFTTKAAVETEIRSLFNRKNDITPEEEAESRTTPWTATS